MYKMVQCSGRKSTEKSCYGKSTIICQNKVMQVKYVLNTTQRMTDYYSHYLVKNNCPKQMSKHIGLVVLELLWVAGKSKEDNNPP